MATVLPLDLLDTQMMDYPSDIDVQMQPSVEPWFQDEAAMQEETHYSFTRSSSGGDLVDVEIDMENYDTQEAQNPEYEMIDEAEDYPVTEVEDVIVADAPNPVPPPDNAGASTLAIVAPTEALHPPHAPSSADELPPVMTVSSPFPQILADIQDVQDPTSSVPLLSEPPDTTETYPEHTEGATLASASTSEEVAPIFPASSDDTPSAIPGIITASSDELHSHLEEDTRGDTDYIAASEITDSIHATSAVESHASVTALVHGDGAVEESAEESESQPEPQPEPVQEFIDNARSAETVAPSEAHEQGHGHTQEADFLNITRDPHEISEGVYIDPPPAVLLSFTFVDHPEVCLFNQPNHSDPSSSTTEVPSYSILLHDSPTLYYEPLSTVFEALRNDGYLSALADLSYAELALDAYDLHLVVSEDNIYAREISLHDLNVLHDGSDISGPLRLHLKTIDPRFIIRYRMLQEQITRLALAEEDGDSEAIEGHYHEYVEGHPEQDEKQDQDQEDSTDPLEVRQDEYDTEGASLDNADQPDQVHSDTGAPEEGETKQEESHQDSELSGNEFVPGASDAVDEIPENDGDGEGTNDDANAAFEQGLASEQSVSEVQVLEAPEDEASLLSETRHEKEHFEDEEENAENFDDIQTTTNTELQEDSSDSLEYQETDAAANEVDSLTVSENTVHVKDDIKQEDHASEQDNEDALYYDESYEENWEDSVYGEAEEADGADGTLDAEADAERDTASVESSVTLSSKNSKRSIHDVDPEDCTDGVLASKNSSPGSKRIRTE